MTKGMGRNDDGKKRNDVMDIFLLQRGRFCGIIMLCIAYNER